MSYADFAIKHYERLVDDEFERSILHKSSTVALAYNDWLSLGGAAVLAWILPDNYAYASLIPVVTLSLSTSMGTRWLRRSTPRPRYTPSSKREIIIRFLIVITIIIGIFFKEGWPDDLLTIFTGVIVGLASIYYAYKRSEALREEDRKALDRKLGPEPGED